MQKGNLTHPSQSNKNLNTLPLSFYFSSKPRHEYLSSFSPALLLLLLLLLLPPPELQMSSGSDTASSGHLLHNLGAGGLGLGYSIAIALGFLLLLSTILLASYACCHRHPHPTTTNRNSNSVILPRIVFVSDDNDDHNDIVGGLDQTIISSYPKFPFAKSNTGHGSDPICSICLCEYREAEMLRMLPDCRHSFHLSCVDAWLRLNASCPVCRRTSPVPTPLSTPLSELVPLSQFPVNGRR